MTKTRKQFGLLLGVLGLVLGMAGGLQVNVAEQGFPEAADVSPHQDRAEQGFTETTG